MIREGIVVEFLVSFKGPGKEECASRDDDEKQKQDFQLA